MKLVEEGLLPLLIFFLAYYFSNCCLFTNFHVVCVYIFYFLFLKSLVFIMRVFLFYFIP